MFFFLRASMGQTGQNSTIMQRTVSENFALFSNARCDTAVEYFNMSFMRLLA